MTRDQARDYINQQAPDFLPRAKKKGYICPKCGQGSTNGIGISRDPKSGRYHCFGMGNVEEACLHADVLELYGIAKGIDSFPEILSEAAKYYGIRIDEDEPPRRSVASSPARYQNQNENERKPDYTAFFKAANNALDQTDYYRGLQRSTLDHFNVGFVPNWTHPKAPNAPPSPRLIIPTSAESYLARDTRSDIPERQKPFAKSKVGAVHIFNAEALRQTDRPVFIVEGEIDAMSVYDAGGEAVALGSISNAKILINTLKSLEKRPALILALDNDEAGEKASIELEKAIKDLGIACYRYNPAGKCKDANERLQKDRAGLAAAVAQFANASAEDLEEYAAELKRKEYREKNAASSYLQEFINGIAENASTPAIPTGFSLLDAALDGGMYAGLYTIGAISSLGKTTLVLQIADNIARSGKDVLIFSLEMAREELIAKSISRHTLEECLSTGETTRDAKTTRGILDGKRYANYNDAERKLIKTATQKYGEYADHIYILQGIGNIGTQEIRDAVAAHKDATGNTPVIVVDYLQILAPADVRATDKQNTDKAVLELKRISRDYRTPVIAVSSLNRENYNAKINTAAFKESGAIEYSADCLIGLQYAGAGSKSFDAETAATRDPREIEAVILKHRNGRKGDVIPLDYFPMFNYFKENGTTTRAVQQGKAF